MELYCSLRYWFRAKGKLSADQALHRYATYFNSMDIVFLVDFAQGYGQFNNPMNN